VMGVVDGWVVVRFKGAVPFFSFWKESQTNFSLVEKRAE